MAEHLAQLLAADDLLQVKVRDLCRPAALVGRTVSQPRCGRSSWLCAQKYFAARRSDSAPKQISRSRHSAGKEPQHRSRWAFKFGLRGGGRITAATSTEATLTGSKNPASQAPQSATPGPASRAGGTYSKQSRGASAPASVASRRVGGRERHRTTNAAHCVAQTGPFSRALRNALRHVQKTNWRKILAGGQGGSRAPCPHAAVRAETTATLPHTCAPPCAARVVTRRR
jgi:hypothetical protein